jgi:uncharacterized membrane protein
VCVVWVLTTYFLRSSSYFITGAFPRTGVLVERLLLSCRLSAFSCDVVTFLNVGMQSTAWRISTPVLAISLCVVDFRANRAAYAKMAELLHPWTHFFLRCDTLSIFRIRMAGLSCFCCAWPISAYSELS